MAFRLFYYAAWAIFVATQGRAKWASDEDYDRYPDLAMVPDDGPTPPPDYMVDNTHNLFGAAPDKGTQNGPVWAYSGSLENYLEKLWGPYWSKNGTTSNFTTHTTFTPDADQSSGYWLTELGPLGKAPLAGGTNYSFWRNVKDYGAKGDGQADDTEAINAAVSAGTRCGQRCGNTFSQAAIVYFPAGTYKICTPIIQLYYTQFIGNPHDRPVIKGCTKFKGIGLIDTDVYIPGANGNEWYINQNQFFRHIRNFVFDLTDMPIKTDDNGQPLVPTGIHWQVAQATTLQNLYFKMPTGKNTTHVGIFTENGSGGFVSDLVFEGGNIGWRVGSQQYTARNLKFTACTTAVQMIWDWGFTWQQIEVSGGAIAFNISGKGGDATHKAQGIGSVSIVDSKLSNVDIGILTSERPGDSPNIVLDNLEAVNVGALVKSEKRIMLGGGSTTVGLWAAGRRYKARDGSYQVGIITGAPIKPAGLLSGGKLFVRSRPQYEDVAPGGFLVATRQPYGIANDGTGDQTNAINKFLNDAQVTGKVAYFPAGIYLVQGTVFIPTGSRVQGSSWSQIMGTGTIFGNMMTPKVVIQVGQIGDVGSMEIVEMLFSVKGPAAGAVVVEWNVRADKQGSAAMWDSHVRVGGAKGSDLDFANCPKKTLNTKCISSSLLLHVTSQASGYFENVWTWIADHDNDMSLYRETDSSKSQVSVYGARGMLIESQAPSWYYGTGSEHAVLYQYQLYNAKNIYMGHIQSETPYYQPVPVAPQPFQNTLGLFPGDPDFSDCTTAQCKMAWGLRVIDSSDIYFHGLGLYSWFNDYTQYCVDQENCQERIAEIKGSTNIALYSLFTKASIQVGSGGYGNAVYLSDSNQSGYTSEISVWFPGPGDEFQTVYIGTEVYATPTARCEAPCIMVLAPKPLGSNTTISIAPYTTSVEVGSTVGTSFVVTTITITITVPPVTTSEIAMSNVNITSTGIGGARSGGGSIIYASPSVPLPPIGVPIVVSPGTTTTRNMTLPPWPMILGGPPVTVPMAGSTGSTTTRPAPSGGSPPPNPVTTDPTKPDPGKFPFDLMDPLTWPCSESTLILDFFPATLTLDKCTGMTTMNWNCPPTKTIGLINADTTVAVNLGCTLFTGLGFTPTTSTSSITPVPLIGFWPIPTPVPPPDQDNDNDDDSHYMRCDMWFFNICIEWPELTIKGWWVKWPKGVYLTGPPPIKWPEPIKIKGTLPPWPRITVPPNGRIPEPSRPSECKTETAQICRTTTSYSKVVSSGTTKTMTSSTGEDCSIIFGCHVEPEHTTIETASACTIHSKRSAPPKVEAVATDSPTIHPRIDPPANSDCKMSSSDTIIYPADPENVEELVKLLKSWKDIDPVTNKEMDTSQWEKTTRVWTDKTGANGFTAFFYVVAMDYKAYDELHWNTHLTAGFYRIDEKNKRRFKAIHAIMRGSTNSGPAPHPRHIEPLSLQPVFPNFPTPHLNRSDKVRLERRATEMTWDTDYWELSQLSVPKGTAWDDKAVQGPDKSGVLTYDYEYHESAGEGQYVYALESRFSGLHSEFTDGGVDWSSLNEKWQYTYTNKNGQVLGDQRLVYYRNEEIGHGTTVGSKVLGKELGVARKCSLRVTDIPLGGPDGGADLSVQDNVNFKMFRKIAGERFLDGLIRIMDDVLTNDGSGTDKKGRAVINYSQGDFEDLSFDDSARANMLYKVLKKFRDLNVLVVAAGHNEFMHDQVMHGNALPNGRGNDMSDYPAKWANPTASDYLDNLLIVGSTDMNLRVARFSPYIDWMSFAPGASINVAIGSTKDIIVNFPGANSYSTPLVAGLAAYLRGLPSKWKTTLQEPQKVKALIKLLQRRIPDFPDRPVAEPALPGKMKVPTVWNGQVFDHSCLIDTIPAGGKGFSGDHVCPNIDDILQPNADKVPLSGSAGGGESITYSHGAPSPTCKTHCGTLCTGYYCKPTPTGHPPDYMDPKDPSNPDAPLPTLPGARPPPGCTTTTAVDCRGNGGHSACFTVTTCVVPTSNPLTSTTTNDPYPTSTTDCRKVPSNWDPSWPAAVEATLNDTARAFCSSYVANTRIIENNAALTQFDRVVDHLDYYYAIGWDSGYFNGQGCAKAPPQAPPSVDECVTIFRGIWKHCDNHGLGGRVAVGCVVFFFLPSPYGRPGSKELLLPAAK